MSLQIYMDTLWIIRKPIQTNGEMDRKMNGTESDKSHSDFKYIIHTHVSKTIFFLTCPRPEEPQTMAVAPPCPASCLYTSSHWTLSARCCTCWVGWPRTVCTWPEPPHLSAVPTSLSSHDELGAARWSLPFLALMCTVECKTNSDTCTIHYMYIYMYIHVINCHQINGSVLKNFL